MVEHEHCLRGVCLVPFLPAQRFSTLSLSELRIKIFLFYRGGGAARRFQIEREGLQGLLLSRVLVRLQYPAKSLDSNELWVGKGRMKG